MKKKGFTLVELLAVIAILAILVIIALPNVMGMFNQAKQNSFSTEIKEIYKQAQQQWISDSMLSTQNVTYYRVNGESGALGGNKIDLTGRTQLDYVITIDKAGKVIEYYATDGSYQYAFTKGNSAAGLEVEQIADGKTNNADKLKVNSNANGLYVADESSTSKVFNNTIGQVSALGANNTMTLSLVKSGTPEVVTGIKLELK